ncbi:MAG: BTAD domain-containing putative transcriptional regulator [Chloroflexota bacterium]
MSGGVAHVAIARPRLLALAADAPVVLLEAPGGFGKTTTIRQLAAMLDRPLVRAVLPDGAGTGELLAAVSAAARRAGLPALAEAVDVEDAAATLERLLARIDALDGVVVAIDEVQRATGEAAAWLAELAGRTPGHARLALAGRRLAPALRGLVDGAEAVLLAADDLRMDADEVARLVAVRQGGADGTGRPGADGAGPGAAEGHRARAILDATDGWPAAVALAAALPEGAGSPPSPGGAERGADAETAGRGTAAATEGPGERRRVLRRLVDELLSGGTEADRDTVARLGQLPLLSSGVAAAVGGAGAWERLLDLGLPVRFRTDGWAELPDPVRELLPLTGLDPAVARAVARLYAERDALFEAAALLRRTGDAEGLATLLAGLSREALLAAGVVGIAAIAAELPDPVLASVPMLLVHLVQATDRRMRLRADWVERALRLLPDPSPERRAVEAEAALDLARGGDLEAGLARISEVLAAALPGELATLGRCRAIRGLLLVVSDPANAPTAATGEIELAVGLLRAAGERAWEAHAWRILGYGCHAVAGRLDAALAATEHAVALLSGRDLERAVTLTELAEIQVHRGDLDGAATAIRESERIARSLGDARSIAFAAWVGARLAAERRDLAAVRAALTTAEANPEGWFDGLAGIDFLADGADMLALAGDLAGATAWIERAEARGREAGREGAALLARARLAVGAHESAAALELLGRLEESFLAAPRDRWLAWLLRAVAQHDAGRPDEASRWLAQAREAVAGQGDPGRIERREPELLVRLAGGPTASASEDGDVADAGSAAGAATSDVTVVLLGRFAVERGGRDVSPPPGRPATLLKLLALRGLVTLDEAVEALWEDADEEVGRARLRNVLNRVRGASGDVLVRREEAIALAPGVVVDATRFEAEAAAALRAPATARVGLARAALTRATGELLPGDRYADWASAARERIARRHLALLDLVADDAIARGDLNEAARLLDEAIALDPLEEERHVRLGRALLRQGRTAGARRVTDRAVALCAELDVEPGDDLARLIRDVARQA